MVSRSNSLYNTLNLACLKHTGKFLPADGEESSVWKFIMVDNKKVAIQPPPTKNWFRTSYFNDFTIQVNRRIITDSIKHLFKIHNFSICEAPNAFQKLIGKYKDRYSRVVDIKKTKRKNGSYVLDIYETRIKLGEVMFGFICDDDDTETKRELIDDFKKWYNDTAVKNKYGFLTRSDYNIYHKFFAKYNPVNPRSVSITELNNIDPSQSSKALTDYSTNFGYITSGTIDHKIYNDKVHTLMGTPQMTWEKARLKFKTKNHTWRKTADKAEFMSFVFKLLPYSTFKCYIGEEDNEQAVWGRVCMDVLGGRIHNGNPDWTPNVRKSTADKFGQKFNTLELVRMFGNKPANRYETLIDRLSVA